MNINWELLEEKQIKPPFIPQIKGETDVMYFDKQFTSKAKEVGLKCLKMRKMKIVFLMDLHMRKCFVMKIRMKQVIKLTKFGNKQIIVSVYIKHYYYI